MERLTVEYLENLGACKEGIDFVVCNGLEGFPLDRLNEVEGDYRYFVDWLKSMDAGGTNIIDNDNNNLFQYEYNELGQKVKMIVPGGDVVLYEYDEIGNLVKRIDGEDYFTEWSYVHDGEGVFTVIEDGEVILTVPKF